MKLANNPRLPPATDINLINLLAQISQQVNGLNEGRISVRHAAMTAAPTTGTWAQGDIVLNSAPTELGVALSKYVIEKFICTVGGTPGTWLQCRSLTGN